MWRDVYEDFSELTKSEQIALFEAMKQDLIPVISACQKSNYTTVEMFRSA